MGFFAAQVFVVVVVVVADAAVVVSLDLLLRSLALVMMTTSNNNADGPDHVSYHVLYHSCCTFAVHVMFMLWFVLKHLIEA